MIARPHAFSGAAPATYLTSIQQTTDLNSRRYLVDFLRAQMGFIEHLNNDPVRIAAIKRSAAIAVYFERVNDPNAAGAEGFFQFFHLVDRFDDKSQVIQLLFRSARHKVL